MGNPNPATANFAVLGSRVTILRVKAKSNLLISRLQMREPHHWGRLPHSLLRNHGAAVRHSRRVRLCWTAQRP